MVHCLQTRRHLALTPKALWPWHRAFLSIFRYAAPRHAPAFSRILGFLWRDRHFLCLLLVDMFLLLVILSPLFPSPSHGHMPNVTPSSFSSNAASPMKPSFLIWLERCSPTSGITHLFAAWCTQIRKSLVHLMWQLVYLQFFRSTEGPILVNSILFLKVQSSTGTRVRPLPSSLLLQSGSLKELRA